MSDFQQGLSAFLMILGTFFSLVASLGVLRMPDFYLRMAAATKAGTLGAGLQLLSVAAYYGDAEVITKAIAAIGFFILTAPVGAHMIARAGYVIKVAQWKGNVRDDLKAYWKSLN